MGIGGLVWASREQCKKLPLFTHTQRQGTPNAVGRSSACEIFPFFQILYYKNFQ